MFGRQTLAGKLKHIIDCRHERIAVIKSCLSALNPAVSLHVDLIVGVDHYLRDGVVLQKFPYRGEEVINCSLIYVHCAHCCTCGAILKARRASADPSSSPASITANVLDKKILRQNVIERGLWGYRRVCTIPFTGEVPERLNGPVSKTGVPFRYRGFESRPLRFASSPSHPLAKKSCLSPSYQA